MAYLILLGTIEGALVMFGAVTVPVLIGSESYLVADTMSRSQGEILAMQIVLYLDYAILAAIVSVILYEGYKYKMFERDRLTGAAALSVIMTGVMFNYYYIPDLLAFAGLVRVGGSNVLAGNILKGSVLDFVFLLISILVLMIQNMRRACR
jgi:hypothetical protein